MKVGDLVKFESALNDSMDHYSVEHGLVVQISKTGEIKSITESYVIVKWVGIPGQWHYTKEQAQRLEIIDEGR